MSNVVKLSQVEEKMLTIREQHVLLDSDVASLYGVETKRVNEAVSNNPDRFPDGYIISLNAEEWKILKSKISTSSWGGKNKLPKVFTEKGLYMLATILKGEKAAQTTIDIVETYAKIRELSRAVSELSNAPDEGKQKSLMQKSGEIIADVLSNDLKTTGTETTLEINFALMKFKHTVKRG